MRAFDGFRAATDTFLLSFTAPALPFLRGANHLSNTLTGSSGVDKGILGSGNDSFTANAGNDIVLGGPAMTGSMAAPEMTPYTARPIMTRFWEALAMISLRRGGFDTLTGGAGRDTFVFNRADRIADRITDFSAVDDIIHIDNFAFRGVGKDGALASGVFHLVALTRMRRRLP